MIYTLYNLTEVPSPLRSAWKLLPVKPFAWQQVRKRDFMQCSIIEQKLEDP
jgi:hypothetical protein